MKHLKLKTKLLSIICLIGAAFTIASCNKDDDPISIAYISVVNAAANGTSLDLTIDERQVNSQAFKYGDHINYFNVYSGTRTFGVYNRSNHSHIASKAVSLSENKPYSLFIADTASKTTFILVEDDLARPAAGKAKIRFVHLSPDAAKLDVSSGDSTIFSGNDYKGYTAFKAIEGDKTYSFSIKLNQTSDAKAVLNNIEIKKNRIYTILVDGFLGKTDDYKFSAKVITNFE